MNTVRRWGPVVLWMGIIFLGSTREHITVSSVYSINFLLFKTLHVLEYAILYVLSYRATKNVVFSFLITMVFAAGDEFHQLYVPTREGRVRDVIIDGLGAGVAWITITNLLPKWPKKLQKWVRRWGAI